MHTTRLTIFKVLTFLLLVITTVPTSFATSQHRASFTLTSNVPPTEEQEVYSAFIPYLNTAIGQGPAPHPRAANEMARQWAQDDAMVANGNVQRQWTWGSTVFRSMTEPYEEATNAWRTVWYFDKGRMEVTNPIANPDDSRYVTSDTLVVEMLTGRISLGKNSFIMREPANSQIFGDAVPSSQTITYRDIAPLASLNGDNRNAPRSGQLIKEELGKGGVVSANTRFEKYGVKVSSYNEAKGHNIAHVFTDAMSLNRLIGLAGNPLTDPYWITVSVSGVATDVLIQPFERRVILYIPSRPASARVEWSNVGKHYAQWRYGTASNLTALDPRDLLDVQSIAPLSQLSAEADRIARGRQTPVGAAVLNMRTGEMFSYEGTQPFPMYSTVKVPIMLTLLQQAHTQRRTITQEEDQLIRLMIQYSDNNATTTLYNRVGAAVGVSNYLQSNGITNTTMKNYAWGLSTTTARDMTRMMAKLGNCTTLTPDLCNYALTIMRGVISSQRWGVSGGVPQGGSVALKNGWYPEEGWMASVSPFETMQDQLPNLNSDPGATGQPFTAPLGYSETVPWSDNPDDYTANATAWAINSIGFVKSNEKLYAVAVYTRLSPTMQYGIDTIESISRNVYPAIR
jgi:hypothetical protein